MHKKQNNVRGNIRAKHSHDPESGFTLIEIMAVVIILGILATIVGTNILGASDKARINATIAQIKSLENALDQYKLDNYVYPSTEQGLKALIDAPSVGTPPPNYRKGGYLKSNDTPKDAWGRDFIYVSPGANNEYDLESYGADGLDGGQDVNADIESWNI